MRTFFLRLFVAVAVMAISGCVHLTPGYLLGSGYEKAVALYESGYVIEAGEAAEKVGEDDPDYGRAQKLISEIRALRLEIAREHMELAEDYEEAGILNMAIKEYRAALKYNPTNAWVKRRIEDLTVLLSERKKVERAEMIETLRGKGTKEPEEVARARYTRGRLYLESGSFNKAIEEFTAVLKAVPGYKDTEVLLERARGERKTAIDYHFKKGIDYFQKENLELAIDEWDVVLDLDPGNAEAADYKKRALAIMEKVKEIKERQGG